MILYVASRRQERVKGQWDALKGGEDTLKGEPVALKQRGYMLRADT